MQVGRRGKRNAFLLFGSTTENTDPDGLIRVLGTRSCSGPSISSFFLLSLSLSLSLSLTPFPSHSLYYLSFSHSHPKKRKSLSVHLFKDFLSSHFFWLFHSFSHLSQPVIWSLGRRQSKSKVNPFEERKERRFSAISPLLLCVRVELRADYYLCVCEWESKKY